MKTKFLFAFLCSVAILVSGCVDFPERISTEKAPQAENKVAPSTGNSVVKSNSEVLTTTKETEPKKEEVKEILYSMSTDVKVDYLTYQVTKAETFTEMGTSIYNKKTEGKFVKVYLRITNNAKETKEILTPRFKIEDNQERKYDRLSDDMLYIADHLEFGKQLQPGLVVSGAIVFEMPKDSEDLRLIITGDWLSNTEIKVQLSNIQNIGKDTTQKVEQDKMWDNAMEEGKAKTEELMSKCNTPFKCSSDCAASADVGRKDCQSGQLCCMTEQSEVDAQMDKLKKEAEKQTQELLNQCNSPFTCTSSCPDYMDVGQKNCPSGQLCCIQT